MGGGDLNLKKSWHPTTIKNMERVWKAEQKHEAEQKKIEELQKELAEERAREEIRHFAEDQGVVKKKSERLDWMYEGVSALANKEEYLLGRAVDKTFEVIQQAETGTGNKAEDDALPESIFKPSTGNVTVDLANKIREDPLLMIKKQEDENRKTLLNNPIRMKQLADMLKSMHSKKKSKKEKKHGKKKRKSKHHSSKRNKNDSGDSSENERKNRKKSENGQHKTYHSFKSEHKLSLESDKKYQINHKFRHKSHSESTRKKRRHRGYSTDSSDQDERLHRNISRKETNEGKSFPEKYHKRERQSSPKDQSVRRRKRSSSSGSNSSCDSNNRDNNIMPRRTSISSTKQYGLIIRSNNKMRKSRSRSPVKPREKEIVMGSPSLLDLRHQKTSNSSRKHSLENSKSGEIMSFKPEKSKKKLDEAEKQRRLQEMMENAKERDIQRSTNLKQHLEEERREALLQMKTAGTDFITPILNKVADVGTVAERIKSNIYNIQRTKADLNKNFAKR